MSDMHEYMRAVHEPASGARERPSGPDQQAGGVSPHPGSDRPSWGPEGAARLPIGSRLAGHRSAIVLAHRPDEQRVLCLVPDDLVTPFVIWSLANDEPYAGSYFSTVCEAVDAWEYR